MADEQSTNDSIADLVQRLSQQTAALVRQELRLAQVELKEKGKKTGIGLGLFGGSAVLLLGAMGAAIAGLILLVAEVVATWIAAFIVAGGLLVLAGIAALTAKKEVEEAIPPKPEAAIESIQADVSELKARVARS